MSSSRAEKCLFGEDGAFPPLLLGLFVKTLEAEVKVQLVESQRGKGNKWNGKGRKPLNTSSRPIPISSLEDRPRSFDQKVGKKRETILAEHLEDKIIGLCSFGRSLQDTSSNINELSGSEMLHCPLSLNIDKNVQRSRLSRVTRINLPQSFT